ncbi:MAG: DUF473 domain-containing protein [Archaeoglobaceae archaeon]|nr:DUF473 domain-containing protein [Archaeoglobaceae archaeon]MCX8152696.1 DUF473 domain-containing protein [Archaeoglobaceae archaeon]MDW8013262.1 DUF473 domain-containing protein [Archaeoglobaceae archaeon]
MKCYVITGITKAVIEEIMRGNIKTLELRSAHNVATALRVKVGDCVFVTYAKMQDIDRGVNGLIAEVTGKEVLTHSFFYSSPHYAEECEMTTVRLRLLPKALGRVIRIKPFELLETREAEVIEVTIFDAR